MGNRLYVGNLPYAVRDEELAQIFTPFGSVTQAQVMMERGTGRSKGFGFVEMHEAQQARSAIAALHGRPLGGRTLVVSEARPMQMRSVPASAGAPRNGYAGRKDNGFRSPYSTGPRQRSPYPAPVSSGGAATAR
ncbi:MAG: RNA-binding protein [Comamonas sp.]|jgi:cold-inducible RNA-binding protein|nr:RNA-binding protein [Comamonas sp.]